jgi:hypothetical protein
MVAKILMYSELKRPQPSLKNWGRHSNAPSQGATMTGASINALSDHSFPVLLR